MNNQITCFWTPSGMRNLILPKTVPSVSKHLLLLEAPKSAFRYICPLPSETLQNRSGTLYMTTFHTLKVVMMTLMSLFYRPDVSSPFNGPSNDSFNLSELPSSSVSFQMWYSELNKMFWVWSDQGRVQAEALSFLLPTMMLLTYHISSSQPQ